MHHETLMDIGKFVDAVVKEPWEKHGEPIYLYHNESSRLVVQAERNSNHDGLWRFDRLCDHNIDPNELDGIQLGRTFAERVCEHLSVNDMRHIRDALVEAIEKWEEEHPPSPR